MTEHNGQLVSIVDDDLSVRRSLGNLLMSAGLRVEAFESAEHFLESASRESTRCLVLDVRMPGMGGLGLLQSFADAGSRIPVIIVTAHADEDTRQRSLQAGAVAFMEKPIRSAALVGAVRSALAQP